MCDAAPVIPPCPIPCVPCEFVTWPTTCGTTFSVQGRIASTACDAEVGIVLGPYNGVTAGGSLLQAVHMGSQVAVPATLRYANCTAGSGTAAGTGAANLFVTTAGATGASLGGPAQLYWWFPGPGHTGGVGRGGQYYAFVSTEIPPGDIAGLTGSQFIPWSSNGLTGGAAAANPCATFPLQIAYGATGATAYPAITSPTGQSSLVVIGPRPAMDPTLQLDPGTVVVAPYLALPPASTAQAPLSSLLLPTPRGLGDAGETTFAPLQFRIL
jgi:hypothetical protein